MFGWFKKSKEKAGESSKQVAPAESPVAASERQHFVSDDPISSLSQDRFNRAPFASRIADTIARRSDSSSLVVGVFGPWGDGKTSVLKMMEEALTNHDHVIVVRFNPWHFQSEEHLLRGFFATLADGLGKELPGLQEKAGDMLKKYGALLSLGSLSVAGGLIQLNPGEAAKGLGEALSNVGLDDLKARIDALLGESGKRVVVMVDDIDRLDREETHSIFKLVKLSASFRHTSYVLAFDDDVVSAALGERYGAGGQQAGRAFLEKIIQVPLHLPPADRISLRMLAFEGAEAALKLSGIDLQKPDTDAFVRHFVDGLEPKLSTPRVAKLYTNALMFALPLLKGEANVVDLMLIEGIRVLYPDLYAAIRDNPDVFLRGDSDNRMRGLERESSPLDRLVESSLPSASASERETIKYRLLRPLFPRTGDMIYDKEWDGIWARDQKICSGQYFKRYFSYGVPDGDVPDANIRTLLENLVQTDAASQRALLEPFANRRAMPRLIAVLRQKADEMEPAQATALAQAIARNADLIPRERGPMIIGGTDMQAGILVSQLLRRLPAGESRQQEAENLVRIATPLTFGLECLRWVSHSPDRPEDRRVLANEGEGPIERIAAARIEEAHRVQPAYVQFPHDASTIYWYWSKVDGNGVVGDVLRDCFDRHPEEVDAFLDCYVGEGWEIESGLPVRSSLDRRNYDQIVRLIDGNYILRNLRLRYGQELDDPQYHPDDQWPVTRKFAHQFAFIHAGVVREALNRNGQPVVKE
ncbi:MAG: AAA family ATPase [Burkholderiales bacterium]|nr:AAA family ATPase [Anaerolineae bacterium]MCZ2419539.1 AAA family ATPase [Burkholderiales bacterium]